jgi:O-glycosyl hydrolase
MFYALGHFSKLIVPGSVVLPTSLSGGLELRDVFVVAARTPSADLVVVILNASLEPASFHITLPVSGHSVEGRVPGRALQTYFVPAASV